MSSDYQAIRRDNEKRYGTGVADYGKSLLADRYADRTHFVFELLQNAEDALARRPANWDGPRAVMFNLTETELRVSHFGQSFSESDVRGICGIDESNKLSTDIGRFGIGFKSVYTFTKRPEVHSGAENFAIENYVHPVAIPAVERATDETVIVIPLNDANAYNKISDRLATISMKSLLFLRQIEKICWSTCERSGYYLRKPKELSPSVRQVKVVDQKQEEDENGEEWLVFSRPVTADPEDKTSHVEVAFSLNHNPKKKRLAVNPMVSSPWVVFFPTDYETNLGFLIQGPYNTTPSRDNVRHPDDWNKTLIEETASLLADALRWLRDRGLLDVAALESFPINSGRFGDGRFSPLFEATKQALASEPLLPGFGGGYISASSALIGATEGVRKLFSPPQLATLFPKKREPLWLSDDIAAGSILRNHLRQEHEVEEITPDRVVSLLTADFLQAQTDDWMAALYEFLGKLPGLRERLLKSDLPLIRLDDGNHVRPFLGEHAQAYLPGLTTDFPTVRKAVCSTKESTEFLRSLGLTKADHVADVIRHVLPNYQDGNHQPSSTQYKNDIERIVRAYSTDSRERRNELVRELRQAKFVQSVDMADGRKHFSLPGDVYMATPLLMDLFENVPGVLLVDPYCDCLPDKEICKLLNDCGAASHLQTEETKCLLSPDELRDIRRAAGLESSRREQLSDFSLRGLDAMLEYLPTIESEARKSKARALWNALVELVNRKPDSLTGKYSWSYSHDRRDADFPADFIRKLNDVAWVPDENGALQRAEFVLFDSLQWESNQVLESKIKFKSPAKEQLAQEYGIDPGVLDFLQQLGVSTPEELRAILKSNSLKNSDSSSLPADKAAGDAHSRQNGGGGDREKGKIDLVRPEEPKGRTWRGEFISYLAAHPDAEDSHSGGLSHEKRVALEENAIEYILSKEPDWQRTSTNNPGFDLYKTDEQGNRAQWCEVKAMSGTLHDRPVTVTKKQFDFAREHGNAYWLYIVQHADGPNPQLIKIRDPAGKVQTFTFDRGWIQADEASR